MPSSPNPRFVLHHQFGQEESGKWVVVEMQIHANSLPETNIALEDRDLEKEIPIGNHHF